MKKKQHTPSEQTIKTNTTMGTAMITARCFCTPDSPEGEISDLDDDGSWDCVKILEGVMGNAVPEGVRKWQLYRRASRTVSMESQTISSWHVRGSRQNAQLARYAWVVVRL